MSFKEVSSLDADTVVAIGKKDKKTGKMGPKQAEGYYLGRRTVENKRGESILHFLQTEKGNLGVWGTTDMNRKLSSVTPGTMVRITANGTKSTPNGDMYVYRVEIDSENTIEVNLEASGSSDYAQESGYEDTDSGDESDSDDSGEAYNDEESQRASFAAEQEAKRKKVEAIVNRNKGK